MDPNTLNLDPDSGFWSNLDPDPGPDPDPGVNTINFEGKISNNFREKLFSLKQVPVYFLKL